MSQNKLLPVAAPRVDAFAKIVKYMTGDGNTQLNADEEKILNRMIFCDVLFRGNRHTTDEIVTQMVEKFTISEFTALKDIKNTQKLFAASREINKKYLSHLHLERINRDIENARDRLFWYEKDDMPGVKFPRVPDALELSALARMLKAYSDTLHQAPTEETKEVLPPPIFVFNVFKGQEIPTGMQLADALAEADSLLNESPSPLADDIDFEELEDDQDDTE